MTRWATVACGGIGFARCHASFTRHASAAHSHFGRDAYAPLIGPVNAAPAAFTPQTGEQDSWSATRNELPQPQAATTLGFSTLKPAPVSAST